MDTISIRPHGSPRNAEGGGEESAELAESKAGELRRKSDRQQMFAQRAGVLSGQMSPSSKLRGQNKARIITSEGKNRIDNVHFGMLLAVSLFFDLLGFIIGLLDYVIPELGSALVGLLIVPSALFTLYMMYKSRGVDFGDSKVLMRFWGTAITNFIPFLSFLPDFTVNVILTTIVTRAEDKSNRMKALVTGGR